MAPLLNPMPYDEGAPMPASPLSIAADRVGRPQVASFIVTPPGGWRLPSSGFAGPMYLAADPTDSSGFPIEGYGTVVAALDGTYAGAALVWEQTLDPTGLTGWGSPNGVDTSQAGFATPNSNFTGSGRLYRFPAVGVRMRCRVTGLTSGTLGVRIRLLAPAWGLDSVYIGNSAANPGVVARQPYPRDAQALQVSVTGGAKSLSAQLNGVSLKTTYLAEFAISGGGATAEGMVLATVTGLLGGTRNFYVYVPAGYAKPLTPIQHRFDPPLIASGVNTPIVVNLPNLGDGNAYAALSASGYAA